MRNEYFNRKQLLQRENGELECYKRLIFIKSWKIFLVISTLYWRRLLTNDALLEQSSFSPPPDQGLIFPTNPAGCAVTQTFKLLALFSSSLKNARLTFHSPCGYVQFRTITEQGRWNAAITGSRGPCWTQYLFICPITPPPRMSQVTRH